jgi:hypothetical protein
MEIRAHGCEAYDTQILRQCTFELREQLIWIETGHRIEMSNHVLGMNAGVGAAGASHAYWIRAV